LGSTHELEDLLEGWLDAHHPGRKRHFLDRLRELRCGELYQAEFGTRMRGTGPQADLLERRFELAFRRLGDEAETPPWPLHPGWSFSTASVTALTCCTKRGPSGAAGGPEPEPVT
jgi:DNA repair photolyase